MQTRASANRWARALTAAVAIDVATEVRVTSLLALRLATDAYTEEARVGGEHAYETSDPFPVRVVPADLLR